MVVWNSDRDNYIIIIIIIAVVESAGEQAVLKRKKMSIIVDVITAKRPLHSRMRSMTVNERVAIRLFAGLRYLTSANH